jgi:hypothetical protein
MAIIKKVSQYIQEAYRMGHFPSTGELLGKNKIYAYYGFLGDGNFGDELVYEAAKKLFYPDILVPVRRRMPAHVAVFAHRFPDRFFGVIIGGGTLIGPSLNSRTLFGNLINSGKPIYMHGTGLHKMAKWNTGWKPLLKGKIYGGIRGPLSVAIMSEFRQDIKIAGDAAFILHGEEDKRNNETERKTVLINCGAHDDFDKIRDSRAALDKFVTNLCNSGADVQFLPCFSGDIELGLELKRQNPSLTVLDIPMTSVGLADAGVLPSQVSTDKIQAAFDARGTFDWPSVFSRFDEYKAFQTSEMAAFKTIG